MDEKRQKQPNEQKRITVKRRKIEIRDDGKGKEEMIGSTDFSSSTAFPCFDEFFFYDYFSSSRPHATIDSCC